MREQPFLSRMHTLIAIVVGVLAPSVTAVSAFYTAKSSIQQEIAEMRLSNIQTFAGKRDLENVSLKMDILTQQVSVMNANLVEMRTLLGNRRR